MFEITNSVYPEAAYILRKAIDGSAMASIQNIQSVLPKDSIFQALPIDHFSLNIGFQVALMHFVGLIQFSDSMLTLPEHSEVMKQPRETFPHLLFASM
jgi:hypothetical protein